MFAVLACTGLACAAEKAPEYQKLRYEEDYRYLRCPDARGDFFDPIKYLPITSDGAAYLSLGGMLRERYEYQSNPLWGAGSQDRSGVFLLPAARRSSPVGAVEGGRLWHSVGHALGGRNRRFLGCVHWW